MDATSTSQDVLVVNVTHSDVILLVQDLTQPSEPAQFARPKFSYFEPLGRAALARIDLAKPLRAPLVQDVDVTTPRALGGSRDIVVGFDLDQGVETDWSRLHLRGSGYHANGRARVSACYLPLAAQIIPTWMAQVRAYAPGARKTVLLVCGAGRPQNVQESMSSNSTRTTADLIAHFIRRFVPGVHEVQVVDSGYDVFSYEENVMFVRHHLLPLLEMIRRQAAAANETWREALEVTVALTEGSPARLGAISAALRPYRPMTLHMWQLKTFWHERRILASDVKFHSFDRVDTTPQTAVREMGPDVQALVGEMAAYRDEFVAKQGVASELGAFWLRKSGKPVLSVLLCVRHGQRRFYRGLNLEVSQPTGSLCSERNAIGSALADDVELNRRDMRFIAVLALPQLSLKKPPTPASSSYDSSSASSATFASSSSSSAAAAAASSVAAAAVTETTAKRARSESTSRNLAPTPAASTPGAGLHLHTLHHPHLTPSPALACQTSGCLDPNPLGPCGACNEWLKKIFDVNPDFRVVTFCDVSCSEVYVREVM